MDGRPCCKKRSRGSLVVRSRQIRSVYVGGGEKMAVYIYCHRLLRSTVAGERFKWYTTEHTKMAIGQVAKAKQAPAKIHRIFRHELFTQRCILLLTFFPFYLSGCMWRKEIPHDTHLQYPGSIAKIVNGAKGEGVCWFLRRPIASRKQTSHPGS
jgi:hypothetical protein